MRILHTADFHVRDKDIEECRKVLGHMVDYAHKNPIDLIIIAGDLTDRNDIKFDSQTARLIIETVSQLSQAAPVFVITGTKTHDGNIPELLQEIRTHFPVYVSTCPEQLFFTGDGFQRPEGTEGYMDGKALISSVPTPTKQYLQSMDGIEQTDQQVGEAMTSIFTHFGMTARQFNLPHILVGHWQVGGAYVSETQQLVGRDIEISKDQIYSAIGPGAPIFYSGSTYAKDFGEMDKKGFWVHELQGSEGIACLGHIHFAQEIGTSQNSKQSDFVELPTRRLLRVSHDYTDKSLDYELGPLAGKYTDEDIKDSHIRVEFRVWQDQRDRIDKPRLEKILLDKGAAEADVRVISVPRQNVRAGRVLQVERLRDKIKARAEIVDDEVPESVLEKCDIIEEEARETIIKKAKEAA